MIVLGIVGSIAGGKSTVARFLEDLGASWIDADSIAKAALDLIEVQRLLVDHFGDQIINAATNGDQETIDRSKLGALVFGDDPTSQEGLRYLEGIVHPIVRARIREILNENAAAEVRVSLLDVPLLFESGWDQSCDQIWCVDADPKIRSIRAEKRGWGQKEISRREKQQLPISEKIRLSHLLIQNDGSLEQLQQTVRQHWQQLIPPA